MGLLFCACLAPPCLIVITRRRREGLPFGVPLAAVVSLLLFGAWSAYWLERDLPMLARIGDPSLKASLLAWGISVVMSCGAFLVIIVLPTALAGYFVDRWLIARWKRRRTIG